MVIRQTKLCSRFHKKKKCVYNFLHYGKFGRGLKLKKFKFMAEKQIWYKLGVKVKSFGFAKEKRGSF